VSDKNKGNSPPPPPPPPPPKAPVDPKNLAKPRRTNASKKPPKIG